MLVNRFALYVTPSMVTVPRCVSCVIASSLSGWCVESVFIPVLYSRPTILSRQQHCLRLYSPFRGGPNFYWLTAMFDMLNKGVIVICVEFLVIRAEVSY